MTQPRIKFNVEDYMTAPPDKRYQLLEGELIMAPSPSEKHQSTLLFLSMALYEFVTRHSLGRVWFAPFDVVLSQYDVVQPDLLFVSNSRSRIVTEANIQGAPDLVVEVLSPGSAEYDRGYKQTVYGRVGVREYWLVDPETGTIEVLTPADQRLMLHASYRRGETLTSPLLAGLEIELDSIFG